MRVSILGLALLGLLAGCADRASTDPGQGVARIDAPQAPAETLPAWAPTRAPAPFASLPDRGELVHYDRVQPAVTRSAYTWHPVSLSEAHALRAVVEGELVVTAPDGRPIRLEYQRHVEHPDGNWTWIGREPGADPGTEAIITFGEKAVFGTIPNGSKPPLRLASAGGHAWLMETDPRLVAQLDNAATRPRKPDFLLPPRLSGSLSGADTGTTAAAPMVGSSTTAGSVVDLVLGYTSGFSTRLGGRSQAVTRLTHLVAITNQAYVSSQIDAEVRIVRTVEVNYADATSNNSALYDLTGVQCTEQPNGGLSCTLVGSPASLQPLHSAREQYGADLVALVRNFNNPENDGCGLAWINGGGQVNITQADAVTGMAVVSDSNGVGTGSFPDDGYVCRDETLAHELGHNMGSAHDLDTSDGDDNVLQANEYGRYPYSFGYKSAAGNFFTVMAYGDTGQTAYRVFSNPAINYCGGHACGVANQADNARSLRQTIPVVSSFRATAMAEPRKPRLDFNGDGVSDVPWRHAATGANAMWLSANNATPQSMPAVTNLAWRMVGAGDVDADGQADLVWRNSDTGANTIWRSGKASTPRAMTGVSNQAWIVAGMGDFNGDGADDVLWRNGTTGANVIWRSANSTTPQSTATVAAAWNVAGVGDFNADRKTDILWRHSVTGANTIWWSGNAGTAANLTSVAGSAWQVAGLGDFNGDGTDDILWRNRNTGGNVIWNSGNSADNRAVTALADLYWQVEGTSDYNGDGVDDILWRHGVTGQDVIWRGASAGERQPMTAVTDTGWRIQP